MKKILISILALSFLVSATTTTVFAEDLLISAKPTVITVAVEAFSVGLGYIVPPTNVVTKDGDTGVTIIENLVGKDHINGGTGVGTYISSFDMDTTGYTLNEKLEEAIIAADKAVTTPFDVKKLSATDFSTTSGFMFLVNNESSMVGLAEYVPQDGDVVRIAFSAFGYGSDIGIDNSSWGGLAPLFGSPSRDTLTKAIADRGIENSADMIKTISRIDATEEDLATAIIMDGEEPLEETEIAPEETDAVISETEAAPEETEAVPSETEPAVTDAVAETNANNDTTETSPKTGVEGVSVVAAVALLAVAGMAISRKKR